MRIVSFNKEIVQYIKRKSLENIDRKILDVGCGKGDYTYFFGRRNKVIGVDLQNVVKEKYRNFNFQIADATSLPFQDNTFDVVISFDVIEHIENDKKMVAEAYRVLKSGGKIFFGTPNKTRLSHFLLRLIGKPVKYPLNLGESDKLGKIIHIREYTAEELRKVMKKSGFRDIKVIPFWFGLTFLKYGLIDPPKFLQKYCHYLFVEAAKNRKY